VTEHVVACSCINFKAHQEAFTAERPTIDKLRTVFNQSILVLGSGINGSLKVRLCAACSCTVATLITTAS